MVIEPAGKDRMRKPSETTTGNLVERSSAGLLVQASIQPGAGRVPLSLHRGDGDSTHAPGLFE
jgi:hypothetical protein